MHICLVSRVILAHGIRGGMEQHAALLLRELQKRGHRFSIITTRLPANVEPGASVAQRTWYLESTPAIRYSRLWWRESARAIACLNDEDPIDLIWSQSAGAFGYLEQRSENVSPVVAIMHGTPLGELTGSLRSWKIHPSPRTTALVGLYLWRWLYEGRRWRHVIPKLAAIVAVSEHVAQGIARLWKSSREQIQIVPNGIDLERFAPSPVTRAAMRRKLEVGDNELAVMATGRLAMEKGFQFLLKAIVNLPQLRLFVLGHGKYGRLLQRQAQKLGLEKRVRFLGHVPHDELPDYLNAGDLFAFTSILEEAFPLSVIEAMGVGLPIVATRVGGVPTAIEDGAQGLLVPPGQVRPLRDALASLAASPALRARLGRAARRKAEARFSVERMVEATESVFQLAAARR